MRRLPPAVVLALTLISLVAIGCQTRITRVSLAPNPEPDGVQYNEQVPVWMFIPVSQEFLTPGKGFPAQIALPLRATDTTNRIGIRVEGMVLSPGMMRLPEGCTLLKAVSFAGGFNRYAVTREVRVTKRDQRIYLFPRHFRRADSGYRIAWYGATNSATDYVLEDGDTVYVPHE